MRLDCLNARRPREENLAPHLPTFLDRSTPGASTGKGFLPALRTASDGAAPGRTPDHKRAGIAAAARIAGTRAGVKRVRFRKKPTVVTFDLLPGCSLKKRPGREDKVPRYIEFSDFPRHVRETLRLVDSKYSRHPELTEALPVEERLAKLKAREAQRKARIPMKLAQNPARPPKRQFRNQRVSASTIAAQVCSIIGALGSRASRHLVPAPPPPRRSRHCSSAPSANPATRAATGDGDPREKTLPSGSARRSNVNPVNASNTADNLDALAHWLRTL